MSVGPLEAQGPAVSAPNGKLSVEGGIYDDDEAGLALGSYTVPLGHTFGLQLDGAAGRIDNDWMAGGGMHLFTRDPKHYLLGAYASFHQWNSIKIFRAAMEAELYVKQLSFTALAGYENVNMPSSSGGLLSIAADDDRFFAHLDLAYYVTENFKIYGGYRYLDKSSLGAAGAEYLLHAGKAPVSVYAKARFGDGDHTRVTGGFRIFFGADASKSLMSRDRTEDPQNYTPVFPEIVTGQSTDEAPENEEPEPECKVGVGGPAVARCDPDA